MLYLFHVICEKEIKVISNIIWLLFWTELIIQHRLRPRKEVRRAKKRGYHREYNFAPSTLTLAHWTSPIPTWPYFFTSCARLFLFFISFFRLLVRVPVLGRHVGKLFWNLARLASGFRGTRHTDRRGKFQEIFWSFWIIWIIFSESISSSFCILNCFGQEKLLLFLSICDECYQYLFWKSHIYSPPPE